MQTKQRATIDDLYRVEGKAELVDGELVLMSPVGSAHGRASGRIYSSLERHEEEFGGGYAYGDNVGFLVDLPRRQSFSPDAAWYTGEPAGMDFLPHAPIFAVEVRSKDDYGPAAERAMADKRRDYFAAGALVVWDVDLQSDEAIRSYHAGEPNNPIVFRRGDTADAEPAVRGWRFPVDRLFA
jgi:Uma2 family endonuclease